MLRLRPLHAFLLALLVFVPIAALGQAAPCAGITHNPQALENFVNYQSKAEHANGAFNGTITAAHLRQLKFRPITVQSGDALYLEYKGRNFTINVRFASGDYAAFDSSPKASNEHWREAVMELDGAAGLEQQLVKVDASARKPQAILFRNIRIIRAGQPVMEFAKLAGYGRPQIKTVAGLRQVPCKEFEPTPELVVSAHDIARMVLDNPPVIRPGDVMVFEANRRDFVLEAYFANGKVVTMEPPTQRDADDISVAWRKGHAPLDFPETVDQRLIRYSARALHQTDTPLLFRGIKIYRQGKMMLELEKAGPGQRRTPAAEPDSAPQNVQLASLSMPKLFGRGESGGYLTDHLPPMGFRPLMFQTTVDTGTDPNHFKYMGKELDSESGLYNFGARYYSPGIGRFMQPDPLILQKQKLTDPQQWNMYAFVRNNPLRFIDPTGKAVQLSDNEAERKRQLAIAQQAVGKAGGSYLYDNTAKDGHHYIGIYTNGPDGKGPAFKDINGAANKLGSIIGDSRIATVAIVPAGTNVSPNLSANGLIAPVGTGSPGASRPISRAGGNEVLYITSGNPGKLPSDLSSTGRQTPITQSDVFSHEMGHIYARWFGGDGNATSVQLENATRQLNGEPTRVGHDEPNDVPPN